jgi:TDG/mug DNA glycosylase family protein
MTNDLTAWKPTRQQLDAARGQVLPDLIAPGLRVLFCGINPSLYSAAVGHHFARPGNRFWPALHAAGFTQRLLSPFEDATLPALGYGLTNLVARATARADQLGAEELLAGGAALVGKVRTYRPRFVAFLGVTAYRTAFARPEAKLGQQRDPLGGAVIWVLPSPSGLNAHYQLEDLTRLYGTLRQESAAAEPGENRRAERSNRGSNR